ncbi:MAG: hypothetical protein KAS52_04600 [Candidatus Heimdallarchaeota archaeon]|nr:hypothetical protein [Candidatus Heimdallarchaeota archaeon]
MSLKTEFEEISKNKWGKGILISWGIFIIFTFWNLIAAFIFTATRNPGYAGQGVISLLALGAAALYLLTILIAENASASKEQLYFVFSLVPLALLFVMAVTIGFLPLVVLLWPYAIMFLGSIGIIVCTYYYVETKGQPPKMKETVQTEDEI